MAPDCLNRPETWLVVAGVNQFELRRVLEEILPHEAGRNIVTPVTT